MNEKNKGIFYGIVAVATLIVAIVGATLAYFSVFSGSNENAVGLQAAVVSVSYNEGINVETSELIPSIEDYVITSYTSPLLADINGEGGRDRCIDDNGHQICHIYNFSISNTGAAVDLTMNMKVNVNGFEHLRYMLYDITDYDPSQPVNTSTNPLVNIYAAQIGDENPLKSYEIPEKVNNDVMVSLGGYDSENLPTTYSMPGGTVENPAVKNFDLVIYLLEKDWETGGSEQNGEQGKEFAATVEVVFGNGDRITGCIGTQCQNN